LTTFISFYHNFKNIYRSSRNYNFRALGNVFTFLKNQTTAKPVSDNLSLVTMEAEIWQENGIS